MKPFDISLPLNAELPVWPGSSGFRLERLRCIEAGDQENHSRLLCDVHCGTHVDAPRHFLRDGATVEALPLDILTGPALVASLEDVEVITAVDLEALALPPGVTRLLLRTNNSRLWATGTAEFKTDFVALSADAAQWVADRGICLIGVDYLSVQRYGESPRTHRILLEAGVIVVEGLNLAGIVPGQYELLCLPLRLVGGEGAPARAVLRSLVPCSAKEGNQPCHLA